MVGEHHQQRRRATQHDDRERGGQSWGVLVRRWGAEGALQEGTEARHDGGETNGREHTGNRRQCEHETYHHTSEVPGQCAVENNKHTTVSDVTEQREETHGREGHEDVEIEEERGPGGWLMLRHRGNDGEVLGGVGRVKQGQRAARPLDLAHHLQGNEAKGHRRHEQERQGGEQRADDLGVHDGEQIGHKRIYLNGCEDSMRRCALGLVDHVKSHKRHGHGHQRAQRVEHRVGDVEARGIATTDNHNHREDGDNVDNKHIPTPRGDHVIVRQGAHAGPHHRAGMHGFHPQVEGENQRKDGHTFVIVRTTDGSGNIGRHHGSEGSRQQTRGGALSDFCGQQIRGNRRQSRENRRNEHAHVADVDGQMQEVHDPIEHRCGKHEARINGASDGTTKRIPPTIVKPVKELQKALVSKVLCSAKVEVGIKLVDDRLVSDHSKEANGKGKQADQAQDCELQHGGDAG
mmetsp:Transcript_41469/g.71933  ORF Transcript_41469/g.71933 Transcript_41469/m.71933 type:complete len:461 (-) Transcript_41469:228-1610(-)